MSQNLSPRERICAEAGEDPLEIPHLWDPLAYTGAATQTLTGQMPPSDNVVCTDNGGQPEPTMADCFKMVMQCGGLHFDFCADFDPPSHFGVSHHAHHLDFVLHFCADNCMPLILSDNLVSHTLPFTWSLYCSRQQLGCYLIRGLNAQACRNDLRGPLFL